MTSAVQQLTKLVQSRDRYDIPHNELRTKQIEAVNERFQQRRGMIKLLALRAGQANLTEVRSFEDMVPLLLPHTAYKSYPEAFLIDERWDKLGRWLDTVSTYRVPPQDPTTVNGIDAWLAQLEEKGFFVSCSSGTTGKSAMLVASRKDMEWCQVEAISSYSWGSGVTPAQDRRIFGVSAIASVPRNRYTAEAYTKALQDPRYERFFYPVPPITVGNLTQMVVLRKRIAEGTATPSELKAYDDISAQRQKSVDDAVVTTAKALIEARRDKLHLTGLWAGLYNVAQAVRDMGYSGKDFNVENTIYVGGGLKRAALPDNYREFVYETFNLQPERNYQNYSMQELQSAMPRCQKGSRYHLPPWLVPLILDQSGDNLLPIVDDEYEGRAAFFDLSLDGRWGGVISGDKVSIDFRPCPCGARGPSIRDNVVRYADLQGDDKIGCAGTIDAYVRGIA